MCHPSRFFPLKIGSVPADLSSRLRFEHDANTKTIATIKYTLRAVIFPQLFPTRSENPHPNRCPVLPRASTTLRSSRRPQRRHPSVHVLFRISVVRDPRKFSHCKNPPPTPRRYQAHRKVPTHSAFSVRLVVLSFPPAEPPIAFRPRVCHREPRPARHIPTQIQWATGIACRPPSHSILQ